MSAPLNASREEVTTALDVLRRSSECGNVAKELAGHIIATLRVNFDRGTIKLVTPQGAQEFEKLLKSWQNQLNHL